jgi:restriction endonuclease Mrr
MSKLKTEDICAIIEKCGANGVSRLTLDSLEIIFHPTYTEEKKISRATTQEVPPVTEENPSQGPESDPISPELLKKLEADIKDERLKEMMITDPAQYEELLLSGALENEDRGTEPTL